MAATRSMEMETLKTRPSSSDWYVSAMERLVVAVQELSHARDIDTVASIVRKAARNLTGADGATFVLRDNNQCYYADENAITPLWKGKRFPMQACVSGWVMLNAQSVMIEDIYADPRVPTEAYRPTFVKSMAMVPIRQNAPIGAIGNYWATHHQATPEEMSILQALADSTSLALSNAELYTQLQDKLMALQDSNYELGRFAWVASHDLQEPLRTIALQIELLERKLDSQLTSSTRDNLRMASEGARRLQNLINSLLVHARVEKVSQFQDVDINTTIQHVLSSLQQIIQEANAEITCGPLPSISGEEPLLSLVFQNLLSNAIKFRREGIRPQIRITARKESDKWLFSVEDNGIGILPEYRQSIFGFFQRLQGQERYAGSGIGLATCKKVIELHHGRIWTEAAHGGGSIFYFTLPAERVES